ncbi:MAG: hypothetical protein KAG53_05365 [Endozoicomonadaceae bacterium]|nr:hypothetical protein [Endozoicomonadaceae bacterium]
MLVKSNQLYVSTNTNHDVLIGDEGVYHNVKFNPLMITNYAFFPIFYKRNVIKNLNNHLPVYPYEMCDYTNQLQLRNNIHCSFLDISSITPFGFNENIMHTVEFFMQIFTMAKQNKICLSLFYNAKGVHEKQYKIYGQAVTECFPNKPVIIISVNNYRNRHCYDVLPTFEKIKCIELKNKKCIPFFKFSDLQSLTEKGIMNIKEIAVVKFLILPKLVMNMLCFHATIPIYAPGASTANLAECFRKPYLHDALDISFEGRVDQSVLDSWKFINKLFINAPNDTHYESIKNICSSISNNEILKAYRYNQSRNKPTISLNQRERFLKIDREIIYELRVCEEFPEFDDPYIRHIMHSIGQSGNIKTECKDYKVINKKSSCLDFVIENNMHLQFLQFMYDETNRLMIYYIQESTTEGGVFYELAKTLQQQALHPDNNMMFDQLDDYW